MKIPSKSIEPLKGKFTWTITILKLAANKNKLSKWGYGHYHTSVASLNPIQTTWNGIFGTFRLPDKILKIPTGGSTFGQ